MFVIQPFSPLIKSLLQGDTYSFRTDVRYRPLSYVICLYASPFYLLFNLLTKEFIALSSNEYNEYLKLTPGETTQYLIRHLFLVEDSTVDYKIAKTLRDIVVKSKVANWDGNMTSFHIFTTTSCNVKCPYCFEKNVPLQHMVEKTAKDVANYIIENNNKQRVLIRWFGGEPLLNIKATDVITSILKTKHFEYDSIIFTNGLLFTPELILKAKSLWHLHTAQITIDGPEKVFNEIKRGSSFTNAYQTVLGNISLLINSGIRVTIRTHITETNVSELDALLLDLASQFAGSPLFSIYIHRLFDEQRNKTINNDFTTLEKNIFDINKKIDSLFPLSFHEHLRKDIRSHHCFGDSPWSISILPDGSFIPCTHYDRTTTTYGNIYEKQSMKPLGWFEYLPPQKECLSCFYYPDCYQLTECPEAPPFCNDWRKQMRLERIHKQMLNDWTCFANKFGLI